MAPYRAVKTMASAPVWNAAGHRLTRCEEQAEKHRHFTCWSATADEWFRAQFAKSSHWLMQFDKRGWLESHCKWRFIAGKITYIYICKSGILHFGCWGVAGCTYPGSWIQHPTRFSSCLRLQKKDKTGQLKWQNMICVRPRQVRKHAICLPHQIHRERQWLARYVGKDWPTRSFILFKINNINSYVLSIFYAHIYIYIYIWWLSFKEHHDQGEVELEDLSPRLRSDRAPCESWSQPGGTFQNTYLSTFLYKYIYIWMNYNDLTATSLESWLRREIIPKWP